MLWKRKSVRLIEAQRREQHWRRWGPYLSERAWGTVREDYSADGTAWEYFPFEHSHLRAYPLGRGRHRRHLRQPPAACVSRWRSGTAAIRF